MDTQTEHKTKRIPVMVEPSLHKLATDKAKSQGRGLAYIIRVLIKAWLDGRIDVERLLRGK